MESSSDMTRGAWREGATGSRSVMLLPPTPVLPGLRTKAVRPRLPSDHVVRPRLIAQLDRGLERRLTLVSAPGGSGKTTLLSAWDPIGYLVAWISLDEGDADLRTFARGMVGAVQLQAPNAVGATQSLLDLADLPAPAALAARLADELAELPDRFVIVLDDYHTIRDDQINIFLTRFVTRITPNVHLVISTREDPLLPISMLRARVELAEVRFEQLTFTTEEAHEFFGNTLPSALGAADGDRLAERTEGWAAGMRLASLAMFDAEPGTGFTVDVEARGVQHARDFIIDQILEAQPAPLQDLLLRSSILDRFCAPLLDALVDDPDETGARRRVVGGRSSGRICSSPYWMQTEPGIASTICSGTPFSGGCSPNTVLTSSPTFTGGPVTGSPGMS